MRQSLTPQPRRPIHSQPAHPQKRRSFIPLLRQMLILLGLFAVLAHFSERRSRFPDPVESGYPLPPLVMQGGDPYIRALMRTISASEANDSQPYSLLYGGQRFADFNRHPDRCVPIEVGPNEGDCTTAAGRYQFLTSTWIEKAHLYHPQPSSFFLWKTYSFEPEFQDQVVYAWLKDGEWWGTSIPELLRQGNIDQVLELLSPTWTSLGFGIETNAISKSLPAIYRQMLQEELQKGRTTG